MKSYNDILKETDNTGVLTLRPAVTKNPSFLSIWKEVIKTLPEDSIQKAELLSSLLPHHADTSDIMSCIINFITNEIKGKIDMANSKNIEHLTELSKHVKGLNDILRILLKTPTEDNVSETILLFLFNNIIKKHGNN